MNNNPNLGFPVGAFPDGPETADDGSISSSTLIEMSEKASSITVDGQSVTRRSISELIELDKHLGNKKSNVVGGWGSVTRNKVEPPGTVGS